MSIVAQKQYADDLLLQLRYLFWLHFFYTYDETHLLIADPFFIRKIQKAKPEKMKYQVATPDAYESAITDNIKKILVFCTQHEVPLVKKLQAQYPDKIITSGTYGYSCTGKGRQSTFLPFKAPMESRNADLVFMITTPYADGEFIAQLMETNGLPMPYEFFGRAHGTWLKAHKNFQISRYFGEVERRFAKDKKLFSLLQTDVLKSLFDNTHFSLERFLKFAKKKNAKFILVNRKDHFAQAFMGSLLSTTPERSVWTKKGKTAIGASVDTNVIAQALVQQQQLPKDEEMLDQIAASGIPYMRIEMEDFIKNQTSNIEAIASFIGQPITETVLHKDYAAGTSEITGTKLDGEDMRRYTMDILGISRQA